MIQASPLLSLLVAIEMTYLILLNNYTTYYQNGQGYLKKNNRLYLYSITERFCSLLSYKYSRLFFIMSNNRLSIYFKIQYTFKPVFHNSSYTLIRFRRHGSLGYTFFSTLLTGPFTELPSSLLVPVALATCSLSTFCST